MDLVQTRIAQNQSVFREANERIDAAAERIGVEGDVPFTCECPDQTCIEIIRLSLETYADVRRNPRLFVNAPGHEAISVQNGAGVVVEERTGYVLVEKVGVAGKVAAEEYEDTVTRDERTQAPGR